MAEHAGMTNDQKSGFILFPLLVHTLDLTVSTIAIFFVRTKKGLPNNTQKYGELEDPIDILKRGYYISLALAVIGLYFIAQNFLAIP